MQTRWSKKRIIWVFAVILSLVIIVKEVVAPWGGAKWLSSIASRSCDTCDLKLNRVGVTFFPPTLRTLHPKFKAGTPHTTMVEAEADRIVVPFSVFPILKGEVDLGHIEFDGLSVKVQEGDSEKAPEPKDGKKENPADDSALKFVVEAVEIRHSFFSYTHNHLGKKGVIKISHIDADIGQMGSSAELRHRKVEGHAKGHLEKSGHFDLLVHSDLFSHVQNVDVKLELDKQKLADLNAYFLPSDGVELAGELLEGKSAVEMKGKFLKASVWARYENFGITMEKTKERGKVSAALQNLVASVATGKQNIQGKDLNRTGHVALEQNRGESFVSFILRGMKEAAMKVASQGKD